MFQRSTKIILRANGTRMFQSNLVAMNRNSISSTGNSLCFAPSSSHYNSRFYSTEEKKSEENEEKTEEGPRTEETPEQIQIRELTEEAAKFKNAYATCLADQENTRRIARQDVKNATEYAVTKLGKSLLDVVDNLDRALNSMKAEDQDAFFKYFEDKEDEELKKRANQIKSVVNGIKIIKKQMLKTLEGSGITAIESPLNMKFDPEFHEALMKQPAPGDAKDKIGLVAHELSTGYLIKDRILRPTKVVVYVDEEDL